METKTFKLKNTKFASFYNENPNFDIITFDFFDQSKVNELRIGAENNEYLATIENLKQYQRLLRIDIDEGIAETLLGMNLDSAHKITAISEYEFLNSYSERSNSNQEESLKIYRKAEDIKHRSSLMFHNIRDMMSPFYKATLAANVSADLEAKYSTIPGYTELFGSLDYCQCEDCRSILSPSAYFVDLMRLVNNYITLPNKESIPQGFNIKERRPDIFKLPLDCEHTNYLVSYLQIVNDVLECKLSTDLSTDATQLLASALYPFNAPYNKPLCQIRECLKYFNVDLAGIYKQYKIDSLHISRESLGVSIEQYNQFITPSAAPDSLTKNYGITITNENFANLDIAIFFAKQTGLLTLVRLRELIYQNLSESEIKDDRLLKQFFINQGGSNNVLKLEINATDPDNEFLQIKNLSLDALDRMNRFIRLSNITGYDYQDIDYVIQRSSNKVIDKDLIEILSKIKLICKRYNIDVQTAVSFFADMKTTGIGNGKIPEDVFDRIYNYPTIFYYSDISKNESAYHPVYDYNPTYQTPIVNWNPYDTATTTQQAVNANLQLRNRLIAALSISDDELTILASRIIRILNITDNLIPMSVSNMTLFYRFSKQAEVFKQKMEDFIELLDLIKIDHVNTLDIFLNVARVFEWMNESGVNVHEIKFIQTGVRNKFVNAVYSEKEIRTMLDELWIQSKSWIINENSFAYNEVSLRIVEQLYVNKLITKEGICHNNEITFQITSNLIQLLQDSFVTKLISSEESIKVYTDLTSKSILTDGYLLDTFSKETDLDFLFEGDPRKGEKIETVRSILVDIKNITYIIAVAKDSFISKKRDKSHSEKVFNDLVAHNILTKYGVLITAISSDSDLSFLFVDDPQKDKLIAEVRKTLVNVSVNVNSVLNTYINSKNLQAEGSIEELANFFNTSVDFIVNTAKFASIIVDVSDLIALLLTPVAPNDPLPQGLLKVLRTISQTLFMCQKINLSAKEFDSILIQPNSYGIESIGKEYCFTINNLQTFFTLKKLQQVFSDTNDAFISYFSTETTEKATMLSEITGWEHEQLSYLINTYLPSSHDANSVSDILWLKNAFDQSKVLNMDVYFMCTLKTLSQLTTENDWDDYLKYSKLLFEVLYSKSTNNNWEQICNKVLGPVLESERDVLVDYMIWYLSRDFPFIKDPDDLYQFMLIDVKMSSINQTSYIKEAIGAVQLYIQRCRMNMEQGVKKMDIREIWWVWMSSYRVWEANRKVFLYPENYIDPNLRNNKSPIFNILKDELTQGDITDERVKTIYMSYFDKLENLSNLVIASSYYCEMPDPKWGNCNNLWLFGRTAESPYTYYYRRAVYKNNDICWEPWKKIEASIGTTVVTPVYAMNKLFLFWTEIEQTASSTFENGNSIENNTTKATIKYIYYNFNEEWIQPQTVDRNIITYYYPNSSYIPKIQDYMIDMNIDLNQENLFWKKPYPICVPKRDDIPEQIIILYGDFPKIAKGRGGELPYPSAGKTSSETKFYTMLYNSINRSLLANNAGMRGYVGMAMGGIINPNLRLEGTNIVLQNYNTIPGSPQPYRGFIDFKTLNLRVGTTDNVLYDNYMGDADSNQVKTEGNYNETLLLLETLSKNNISINMVKNMPGWFIYDNGDEVFIISPCDTGINEIRKILKLNHNIPSEEETDLLFTAFTSSTIALNDIKFKITRLNTVVTQQLSAVLFADGLDKLLTIESQKTAEMSFSRFKPTAAVICPKSDKLDFGGAYGLYFWEVFFYTPFIIANSLSENQNFAEAQKWYHYIFNPVTKKTAESSSPNDRYWGFLPFWGQTPESMEEILTDSKQIAVYNNDPFDPDAIAHLRSTTFQKAIVMKYIDNLISWADNLFAQDTWEAIGEATMLYVKAKDLLGDKPELSGTCKQPKTLTFQEILDKYGADIPQFLINLENIIKPSSSEFLLESKPYNDINSYFCIGENKKFMEYWDTVEDRLFKIRHSMNIYGEKRTLSLYEFPIDPMALIRAFSSSGKGGISKVLSSLSPKIPEYRFNYIVNQAKNVTSSLVSLGGSLLSALEKKDIEYLTLLRQTHEQNILNMTLRIKDDQLSQAKINLKALSENLKNAQSRCTHYTNLINTGLIPSETLHLHATILSNVLGTAGSVMKLSSSIASLVPNVGSPFAMTYGGREVGSSLEAVGSYFELLSSISSFVGNMSLTMAGYERRKSDWEFQKKTAEYDISNIEYQIETAQIAQLVAEREIDVARKQVEQNNEIESFYRTKFTNEDLYLWMINRLSTIYFQTYTLAYELALGAEKAYQFERNANDKFIDFGYWDSLKKGLYSGEALQLSLAQLENAYMTSGKRTLEIKKSFSLLQNNPMELINLKTDGVCYFEFPEKLFDLDYPGHYCRQLKSISITIPAIVGPYQNIKASLTQLTNKIILTADFNSVAYLLGDENASVPDSGVLRSNWKINQQIILSTGVNDSGLFQLNFGDERYLPFEGTGAVSTWKFEMDKASNPIDFDSISDVVIQLNYEAVSGDESFKSSIKKLPELSLFSGYQLFNLNQQYASEWFTFMHPEERVAEQAFYFNIDESLFRRNLNNLKISDISLMLDLTDKTTFEGNLTIKLNIINHGEEYVFDNNSLIINKPLEGVESYFGKWSLVVKKSDIPEQLKTSNGFLDESKVKNIAILMSYSGNI